MPYSQLRKTTSRSFPWTSTARRTDSIFRLVFASIVLFFWLRNIRENSMMMGSGGGIPGGRGGMPGGGMPGGIPGAGRQVGGRSLNGRGRTHFPPPADDVRGRCRRRRSERVIRNRRYSEKSRTILKVRRETAVWVLFVDRLGDWKDFVNDGHGRRLACRSFQSPRANSWSCTSEWVHRECATCSLSSRASAGDRVYRRNHDAVAKGESDGKMKRSSGT